jgi:hypothetical protein
VILENPNNMKNFIKQKLREVIKASDAHSIQGSVQTILDGKRDVGIFSQADASDLKQLKELGLDFIKVPSNPQSVYVMYNPRAKAEAMELVNIAEKYEGYFAWYADEEDTRRIGQLLGYDPADIEEFVQKMNKQKKASGLS